MPTRRAGGAGGFAVMPFVVSSGIYAIAFWAAAELVDGIYLQGLGSTLAVALIFAILNYVARALFPIGILSFFSFGLFALALNMTLLLLTDWIVEEQDTFTIRFAVTGWVDALAGALIISVVSFVVSLFLRPASFR